MLLSPLLAVLAGVACVRAQSTAGVPDVQNVGNGQTTATIPSGLGGLSTGTPAVFTPGADTPLSVAPYQAPTDAAGSASLASILTHYSQAITAPTPTTGPPTGISTGISGGFTGSDTSSVLDGRITTIPNAATTYTGVRPSASSDASTNAASAASSPHLAAGLLALLAAAAAL